MAEIEGKENLGKYEILFVKASGKVVTIKPSGWRWSDLERSGEFFGIQELEMPEEDVRVILDRVDEFVLDGRKGIVHKLYGEKWKFLGERGFIKRSEESVADEVCPGWRETGKTAIETLHPSHWPYSPETDFLEEREAFLSKLLPLCDEPGMKALLAAIKYGCYGDIVANVWALPKEVLMMALDRLNDQDRAWIERLIRNK